MRIQNFGMPQTQLSALKTENQMTKESGIVFRTNLCYGKHKGKDAAGDQHHHQRMVDKHAKHAVINAASGNYVQASKDVQSMRDHSKKTMEAYNQQSPYYNNVPPGGFKK